METTPRSRSRQTQDRSRIRVYVRDDKPFGAPAPPAAVFCYPREWAGEHPQVHLTTYTKIYQADAYSSYGKLYARPLAWADLGTSPSGGLTVAGCLTILDPGGRDDNGLYRLGVDNLTEFVKGSKPTPKLLRQYTLSK
jgi:hypothetical protein